MGTDYVIESCLILLAIGLLMMITGIIFGLVEEILPLLCPKFVEFLGVLFGVTEED